MVPIRTLAFALFAGLTAFTALPVAADLLGLGNVVDTLLVPDDDLAEPDATETDAAVATGARSLDAGVTSFETVVDFDNHQRHVLYLRPIADSTAKVPAIVMLHYHGGTPQRMVDLTDASRLVRDYGIWVILPESVGNRWSSDPRKDRNRTDDSGFLARLIDDSISAYPLDARRIYMAGFSAGGFMAQRFVCEHSERVAAVAWSSAELLDSLRDACPFAYNTPIMTFHGTKDPKVGYDGRLGVASAPDTAAFFAGRNGCGAATGSNLPDLVDDHTTVHLDSYASCSSARPVRFYTVNGGGHTWPGNDYQGSGLGRITQDINATQLIWDFVKNYSR